MYVEKVRKYLTWIKSAISTWFSVNISNLSSSGAKLFLLLNSKILFHFAVVIYIFWNLCSTSAFNLLWLLAMILTTSRLEWIYLLATLKSILFYPSLLLICWSTDFSGKIYHIGKNTNEHIVIIRWLEFLQSWAQHAHLRPHLVLWHLRGISKVLTKHNSDQNWWWQKW